ncbi:MAG: hypothetical protein AAF940_14390, partial [Pseudomonadota bacterium]
DGYDIRLFLQLFNHLESTSDQKMKTFAKLFSLPTLTNQSRQALLREDTAWSSCFISARFLRPSISCSC